jgi:hypothetical protein
MAASGAGDLLARHITGEELPDYAESFLLSRYEDLEYMRWIDTGANTGQL